MDKKIVWSVRLALLVLLGLLFISLLNMLGISNPFYNPFSRPAALPKPITPVEGNFGADEKNTIEIFKRISPSVVFIQSSEADINPFTMDVYRIRQGTGSGFVWDHNGHIVTNYHVIKNARSIKVRFQDEMAPWNAAVVGVDPENDIAVLRCGAPPDKLQPVIIGDSTNLQVGQKVLAIGNPFGLDSTLTVGIISALGRQIRTDEGWTIDGLIQSDAAINPGNSGGPLLDSFGRVIGVNTAILSPSGANSGIGFAVPIDRVNEIVPHLITSGKVPRPFLGVSILPPHVERMFDVEGMVIRGIVENSPAEKAGLNGLQQSRDGDFILGDVILKVNEDSVSGGEELIRVLRKYNPGDTVTLTLLRDNNEIQKKVRLDLKPEL